MAFLFLAGMSGYQQKDAAPEKPSWPFPKTTTNITFM